MSVTALTAALTAAGAVANWAGSAMANRAIKKDIAAQREKNDAWWNIRKNQEETKRADKQAYITRQQEMLQDANYLTRATNKVAGGSEEAAALQKEASNKAAAQTVSNLAAQGAAEKRADEQQYRATDAAISQQEIQRQQQRAAQNAAAGSQVVNAGISALTNESRNLATDVKPVTQAEPQAAVNPNSQSPKLENAPAAITLNAGETLAKPQPLGDITQRRKS